jgi:hypothetical protein
MKQINIKTTAQGQNREGIKDIITETYRTIIQISYAIPTPHQGGSFTPPLEGQGGGLGGLNIFLAQNKGKGPPGRVRSPGAGWCLRPDNQQATNKNNKTNYNTEFQYFNQFFIFYHN